MLSFLNDPATTEIYTLSLHDALPISGATLVRQRQMRGIDAVDDFEMPRQQPLEQFEIIRSEEHTSELQSRGHLVCRLLLEKKKDALRRVACFRSSMLHLADPTPITSP